MCRPPSSRELRSRSRSPGGHTLGGRRLRLRAGRCSRSRSPRPLSLSDPLDEFALAPACREAAGLGHAPGIAHTPTPTGRGRSAPARRAPLTLVGSCPEVDADRGHTPGAAPARQILLRWLPACSSLACAPGARSPLRRRAFARPSNVWVHSVHSNRRNRTNPHLRGIFPLWDESNPHLSKPNAGKNRSNPTQ